MNVVAFLHGVSASGSLVASVLFLKFFRETHDRIFLWFACAFVMLMLNWTAVSLMATPPESRHLLYIVRLAGFLLIIGGIVDRNRRR